MVQNVETKLQCVCEGLAKGSRRVRDTCDDLAIVLRRFLSHVRDACEDHAIPCKRLATV